MSESTAAGTSVKRVGFFSGILLLALCTCAPVLPVFHDAAVSVLAGAAEPDSWELARSMQAAAGLFFIMIVWWITEAVPLPATALLPAVLLPALHVVGVGARGAVEFTPKTVLAHYANPVIYLFLGGFLLAAAMQRWGLDRRLTLWLLSRGRVADNPRSILLGVMAVTAFLSMWISNTATAAMMLPIGLGILTMLALKPGDSPYGTAMMLGIAYAASIGGVGTIIGTPPNGIALGILDTAMAGRAGYESIGFLEWMVIGVPFVVLMVPMTWLLLLRLNPPEVAHIPGGRERLRAEHASLGPMSTGEKRVLGILGCAAILWISNPFWGDILPNALAQRLAWIDEFHIGLCAGALCFFVPVHLRRGEFVLRWDDAASVDWGTLVLFGGGIALSDALFRTGLAPWVASSVIAAIGTPSTFVLVAVIVLFVDFLTEVTSNTAVTSMMVPVVISIAAATGADPAALAVAAAIAASLAFMLPVATPPNALVYGTGYVPLRAMVRNGFALDILGWLLVIGLLPLFGDMLFGLFRF